MTILRNSVTIMGSTTLSQLRCKCWRNPVDQMPTSISNICYQHMRAATNVSNLFLCTLAERYAWRGRRYYWRPSQIKRNDLEKEIVSFSLVKKICVPLQVCFIFHRKNIDVCNLRENITCWWQKFYLFPVLLLLYNIQMNLQKINSMRITIDLIGNHVVHIVLPLFLNLNLSKPANWISILGRRKS